MEQKSFITEVDALDEAKECFLTYSAEVLTDRAIPSAEDGLLSSQRKILWTMSDFLGMDSKGKTKKCNAIIGSTLATSYFHGDQACYGVLCKMSQKYLMRYPLIHGQGSLGTQEDNDLVASSRYTEAKPSIYTDLMMLDYKKHPVPTKETYNGEYMEPVVLPSLFPNAICNGRQAIGISMSHNSLPNNLKETCDAIIAYIKNPDLTIDDIMQYMKGPDFPLGNIIINQKDIKQAYATGKSQVSLKVRGDYVIDGNKIIFTTIPYRTYRNKIKEQLEKNVEAFENVLDDFNDESNIGDNRLVFFAKPGQIENLLDKLFTLTDLQTSISFNMNYIVNGTPKLCSIKDLIKAYVTHQNNVMINIANTDLAKAQSRQHIVEGLLIAIKDIDMAIRLIKESLDKDEACQKLINHFNITETQANAILDMKLARLTKLNKNDLLKELEELQLAIIEYKKIINEQEYRNLKLIEKVTWLRDKYGDDRRTKIVQLDVKPKTVDKEVTTVEPEKCVVIMTENGSIKRIPTTSFKVQKRNGKGIKTQDDITNSIIRTNTVDTLMIFTNQGRMYRLLVDKIPVGTNTSKGVPAASLVNMLPSEKPVIIYSIYKDTNAKFIFFCTKKGLVKKVPLTEYQTTGRKSGSIQATKIKEDDELCYVSLINDESVALFTKSGMGLRFKTTDLPISSRVAIGVKGITLATDDEVIQATVVRENDNIALFTRSGMCKQISQNELMAQNRGGKGLMCYKNNLIAGAISLAQDDSVLVVGDKKSICLAAKDITIASRASAGVSAISASNITSVSKI